MIIEGEDGVTHINIYSKGKTKIGRWLSNFTQCQIRTEQGWFNSIEGYWYWLTTFNDTLRELYGYNAKKVGKESSKERTLSDKDFKKYIKKALDLKIKTNIQGFYTSSLPFCHYYEYGGKRVDAKYEWIVEHFEKRRKELKEHFRNKK